jgi:hypothetical protein
MACPKYSGDNCAWRRLFRAALALIPTKLSAGFKDCLPGILCIVEIPSFDIASAIAWFDPSPSNMTIVDHGTLCTLRLTMI